MTTIAKAKSILSKIEEAANNEIVFTEYADLEMDKEELTLNEVRDIVQRPKWLIKETLTEKGRPAYKIRGRNLNKAVVTIDEEFNRLVMISVMHKDS